MRGVLLFLLGAALVILAVPFLLLAGWGLVFGVPTVAIVAFTVGWLLLPLFHQFKLIRVFKIGVSFLVLPATLGLAPMMVGEVDRRVEELNRRDLKNPAALSFVDKVGVYGLNIVMAAAAAPLYPEAAKETFLMCFPPPKDRLRVFHSEFGLGSARLSGKLREWVSGLAGDTVHVREFGPEFIEWSHEEYRLTNPEARYGLALNQTHLKMTATRTGNRYRLDVSHLVGIAYPSDAYVPLITRPRLRMQEGLFWVLQQSRWLHPYNAEWRFTIYSDDPRLKN